MPNLQLLCFVPICLQLLIAPLENRATLASFDNMHYAANTNTNADKEKDDDDDDEEDNLDTACVRELNSCRRTCRHDLTRTKDSASFDKCIANCRAGRDCRKT